jgi:ABC-type anion transport system duplicated permease subunit
MEVTTHKDIKLPGLGSFMASAVDRGDNQAAMWAIIAMLVVILATDQLAWRPLLAWADRFKIELTESSAPPRADPFNEWKRNSGRRLWGSLERYRGALCFRGGVF